MTDRPRQIILDVLNEQQKHAFSHLAAKLVLADWRVPDDEDDFVQKIRAHLDIDEEPPQGAFFADVDFAVFDTKRAKNATLVLLFLISYADQQFHPAEAELLEEWAGKMGVSPEEAERMRAWSEEHIEQMRQIIELLGED